MINSERVMEIMYASLFTDSELELYPNGTPPEDLVLRADGIQRIGFHKERCESHRDEVIGMLKCLPGDFMEEIGGGGSFLNMCQTKDGEEWTDLHMTASALLSLGLALGLCSIPLPRFLWPSLPGGVPYVTVLTSKFPTV